MSATPRDAANWFEIPATDLDRATTFYEFLLGTDIRRIDGPDPKAFFPAAQDGVGGAIVHRPSHQPGSSGPMIYLNVDGFLKEALDRARSSGAHVLVPATPIPGGFGTFACILDSEGNHIGLAGSEKVAGSH